MSVRGINNNCNLNNNVEHVTATESEGGVSVVAHTTRQFGANNIGRQQREVLPELVRCFRALMPHWPHHSDAFCHKWQYSQVWQPYNRKKYSSEFYLIKKMCFAQIR